MKYIVIFFTLFLTLILAWSALAQPGGGSDLTWNTIDSGGGSSAGGNYSLSGTIGQFDAGTLSSSNYTLGGGFWHSAEVTYRI